LKFPADSLVQEKKLDELKARLERLGIDLSQVIEKAITSSGPGGQKANRAKSGVQLKYEPSGLIVRCVRERARSVNRYIALRKLADAVEARAGRKDSLAQAEIIKVRKQKDRRKRRRKQKRHHPV